jgi:outer membrane protein assembly factor BamB
MPRQSLTTRLHVLRWLTVVSLAFMTGGSAAPGFAQWLQWGGPNRDFSCNATGLADKWLEAGPPVIWRSEIGPGHSTIVVDGDTLYTMCRRDENDAVVAYNAKTGEVVWETQYDAPIREGVLTGFPLSPHSTPLIVGERIFAVGGMTHFHCLDKKTGKILWSHDLMAELGTSHLGRGYGPSPIAYQDMVIVNVGARRGQQGSGLAAFKQETGEVVWKSEQFGGGYASPILARFNGEDHLVVALGADRIGLDPSTGKTRWRTQVDFQSYGIMATPLWIPPDKLFCTAGYGGGTRLFKIGVNDEGEYGVDELWYYRKMQVVHGTFARVGDVVYGSSHGSFGPAFLMAIDLKTGKPLWRERGFAKANVLYADGKLIILDEEGTLALATATPESLEVHSKAKVLERLSWTAPTLVGTTLYLRDHHTIKALDLSAAGNS